MKLNNHKWAGRLLLFGALNSTRRIKLRNLRF